MTPRAFSSFSRAAVPQPLTGTVRPLTDTEFARFRQLIEPQIGIHLTDAKRPLLLARLARRMRKLGMGTFSEYYDIVVREADERTAMLDAVCTHETAFFRERQHFELLRTSIFPQWRAAAAAGTRSRSIRIWSAACSTGEEPYSLAMLLLDEFGSSGWDLRVDATDVSGRALEKARSGIWAAPKASAIPDDYLRRFMLRGTREKSGTIQAGAAVRAILRFGRLNLVEEKYAMGEYDAVLCRNVLIYFTAALRAAVVQRLLTHVAPGGYFFVGHAETLAGVSDAVRSVIPTVYVR